MLRSILQEKSTNTLTFSVFCTVYLKEIVDCKAGQISSLFMVDQMKSQDAVGGWYNRKRESHILSGDLEE